MAFNRFRWQSLQTRVTLFTLAIFLASVWSLSLYASHRLRQDMQRALSEQQYATVSFVAGKIKRDVDDRLAALTRVAAGISPALLENASAMQNLLEQQQALHVLFNAGIWVTRADGIAIANVPQSLGRIGIDYSDRDYIREVLDKGRSAIGRPVIGVTVRLPAFGMSVPILDAQGKVAGVLAGGINLGQPNFLDEMTDGRYGKSGGYLLIAPKHQIIVTGSDKSRVMQPVPAPGLNKMHDRYMQGFEGYGVAINSRGVEELSAARRIASADWFVVAALPSSEAFAPIADMQRYMLLATALVSLLVGALTWWVTTYMLQRQLSPVLNASRTLALQAQGQQLVVPLPVTASDEIGELIHGFNQLMERSTQRESLLKQILDTSSVAIFLVDKQGRITQANQRMAEMFNRPTDELVGSDYVSLIHPDERDTGRQTMQRLLCSGIKSVDLDRKYWRGDHTEFWGRLTGSPFIDGLGVESGLIGVIADITERKRLAQFEQFRSRVLELLASDAPPLNALEAIVTGVEQMHPGMLCSILLLDDKRKHLATGVAPSLPAFYNAAIKTIEIGIGVGSCGTAAFTGERVIVEDIATHPYWAPFKDLAAQAGLGACWSQPIFSANGTVLGSFAIYHRQAHAPLASDLTVIEQTAHLASIAIDRSTAAEKLTLAASVFTHAREGILITTADGTIVDANDTLTHLMGYSHDEMVGQNPRLFKSGRQAPAYYESMWHSLGDKGHWYGEIWNRRKDGSEIALMQTISAVRDVQGRIHHFVSLLSDITAIKAHQSQLEHIAHFDALTQLPNRVLLGDRLRQGMTQTQRRNQTLAVAYLDLDGFKSINDRYGHDIGDQLLMTLATGMRQTLRDGDTLARMGGDEFVAILGDLDSTADCMPMLERLLAAAAQKVTIGELMLQVSASLGATFYPQPDDIDADQLLRQADQAMYQAKQAGKNRYHVFDAAADRSVRGHHEDLEHIRHAIDAQQLVLHFQPKVNMRTGEVIGAEALIRWQHPVRGLLAPAVFLPVIENHPMAVEVGEWVIHTALSQMQAWQAQGLKVAVSVNVGSRQLQQLDFVDRLRDLLARHGQIQPGSLELEILETSALEDVSSTSMIMRACNTLGVSFALDDFGTGYSSLTYLKRLPVAVLKIDQSFVRDMLADPDDLAILTGVIGLANAFKREVIAEGVETVAHGVLLLQLGCDLAQGYGIARPMPGDCIPDWVAAWHSHPEWIGQNRL
jgi:diguanylate cyclase (GGDEF)-like protein/PAS domain S-box-containing protein